MQYSTLLIAAFAAQALARAVPNAQTDLTPIDDLPTDDLPIDDLPTDDLPTDDLPTDDTPIDDTPIDDTPTDDTPIDDTPTDDTPTDDTEYPAEEVYVPAPQPCYEDEDTSKNYGPAPYPDESAYATYKEQSPYKNVEYVPQGYAGKPYPVKYHHATSDYKAGTDVYIVRTNNYEDKSYKLCDDYSGDNSCDNAYLPEDLCPSDDKDEGSTYRLEFCEKDTKKYTYSSECYIYNPKWYEQEGKQPDAKKCPPPPKEPEYPASPVSPPKDAPVKPVAPVTPPPAIEQPVVADNGTVYTGAAGAVRASVSLIVGFAAFVTFAL